MSNLIVRLLGLVLGLLLPPSGRRRLGVAPPPMPTARSRPTPTHRTRPPVPLLRGEDCRLVRPYLGALETARAQRERRRALWLALHGIDVGPRRIHGVEVAG